MKIHFLGAAGEVTGSCHLVEDGGVRFLVDCGLFQGGRDAYGKNLASLAFDLKSLDFVVLTHAHLDHSGLLPRLVALGYKGPIYTTPATADLLGVLLADSAHIQEKEWEWASKQAHRRGWKRVQPPLYTVTQAQQSLKQLQPLEYGVAIHPRPSVRLLLRDAGHILGSSIAEIEMGEHVPRRLVFSGDLGMPDRPLLQDPESVALADVLVIESTYGDRCHRSYDATRQELVHAIRQTLEVKGGNVVIPAFAVGRTQELLFLLADLVRSNELPPLKIYVDSPMASAVTALTAQHMELWDMETRALAAWMKAHRDRVQIQMVEDVQESMALNDIQGGAIIISASGMCEAGRIKYHLKYNLGRRRSSIIISGFQAAGTLGRRLVDGARQVSLFGERVNVVADVYTIGGLSAHADREGLLAWLRNFQRPPGHTFVVHGEAGAAASLAEAIRSDLRWDNVCVPARGEIAVF